MKKLAACLLTLAICATGFSQVYFQATMQKNENNLIFKIKPVNGNINNIRFSAIEFFVRYPDGSPAFTWGTPTVDPQFAGMNFSVTGPNTYGAEPGYTNWGFAWIGGATFVPAAPTTYIENTEYTVFTVPLLGSPNTIDMEFVHNTNQSPTYINISDNSGNSLSCIDNNGNTIGDAFYGPGFNIINAQVGGNDHILPLADVPIPVKFTGFTAEKKVNDALLTWNVENETAVTDFYEIQRSLNGRDFTGINKMNARVVSGNTANVYTYTDLNLKGLGSNTIYYRIKQVDKDGKVVYSEIRSVQMDGKAFGVHVYPNPVLSTATLNIDLTVKNKISFILTDAAGKELQHGSLNGNTGLNTYRLDLTNVAAGTYQLKVVAGTDTEVLSVIKSK
jgi:hypothetical protein